MQENAPAGSYDTSSREEFVEYYAAQSVTPETLERFTVIRDKALSLWEKHNGMRAAALEVVDIGCGAGTSSRLWAEKGHRVRGLDVNAPLIQIARDRSAGEGMDIRFDVGSATALPYPSESCDICVMPELLEHVREWEQCLEEAVRVLRSGGILYLSTTNTLCPVQQEFNLPLYSWYPGIVKRYCERLAVTTRPALASYATYPAVNWFNFFELSSWLARRGLQSLDRFDLMDDAGFGLGARAALRVIRAFGPARFMAHVLTPYVVIFAARPVKSTS